MTSKQSLTKPLVPCDRAGGGGVPHRGDGEQPPDAVPRPPAPCGAHPGPQEAEPTVLSRVHRRLPLPQRQRLLRQEPRVWAQDGACHHPHLPGESGWGEGRGGGEGVAWSERVLLSCLALVFLLQAVILLICLLLLLVGLFVLREKV